MSQRDVEAVPQPAPIAAPQTAAPMPVVPLAGRAGGLAGMGLQQRAAAVRALSAGAGNAAVSRVLARSVYSDLVEFKHGIEIDLPTASTEEKLAEIQRLLAHPSANPFAPTVVWESMNDLASVAKANLKLFLTCAKRDKSLLEHEAFDSVRKEFKAAVEGRVLGNLQSNRDYVTAQMEAVGVTAGADPAAAETTADQDHAVRKAQLLAEKVALWQEGMAKAKLIKVGRNTKFRSGGYRRDFDSEVEVDATFDPDQPPAIKGAPKGRESEFKDYGELKQHYDMLDAGVKKILAESPAVFAIVNGGEAGAAADFAKQDTGKARAQLAGALTKMGSKIEEAVPLVGDDLDYRDFIPVHQQLMGAGPFSGELEKAIIANDVEGHEMGKVLRSLALGGLSAAAFLVAEFATAGMATFIAVAVGIGASAGNAALSIDDYLDKAKAHGARTGDTRNDIVTSEQVDSALFQAVMDTALAFIDAGVGIFSAASKALGPGAKLLEAAEAGAAKASTVALADAMRGGDKAAQLVAIEKSLAEAGVDATAKAAGKTPEELAKLFDPASETARRLQAAGALGAEGAEGLVAKLADFAALEPGERATVMRAAIDQFGYAGALRRAGGWKAVTKTLGEGHELARELDAWRSSLVRDMQEWLEAASKGESKAVQTGTPAATSDVDVSTVGRDAAQNVERALEFISRRAGVSRAELESLLDLDAAVNPARMHLQDVVKGLSPQARAAIDREAALFEEALSKARADGTFKPLPKEQIGALNVKMDEWSAALAKLEAEGGSEAQKAALIQKIGRTQAEVLASSETMYGTGGSIRKWVTERPASAPGVQSDLEKLAQAGVKIDPAAASIWPGQRFTAIVGEGHFLERAFAAIAADAEGTALVSAIKDFGKHGGRVTEILGRDVAVTGMSQAAMNTLADNLALWLKASKGPLADAVKDAAQLGAIRAQLATQVGQLRTAMTNGVGALRAQAQLGTAMSAAELAGIDAWVRAQAASQLRGQWLLDHLLSLEQAVSLPAKAVGPGSSAEPEPNTSTPEGPVYSPPR